MCRTMPKMRCSLVALLYVKSLVRRDLCLYAARDDACASSNVPVLCTNGVTRIVYRSSVSSRLPLRRRLGAGVILAVTSFRNGLGESRVPSLGYGTRTLDFKRLSCDVVIYINGCSSEIRYLTSLIPNQNAWHGDPGNTASQERLFPGAKLITLCDARQANKKTFGCVFFYIVVQRAPSFC